MYQETLTAVAEIKGPWIDPEVTDQAFAETVAHFRRALA